MNNHSFQIIEHDPMLYEDASKMVEYVAQHMKQASREATVLLYASALDPHLQEIMELADRVFCFYEGQQTHAKGKVKAEMKMPGTQATLRAFS